MATMLRGGKATLQALHGDIQPKEFALAADVCVLGRESTCDMVVPRVSVSRQHAKIEQQGNHFILSDLGSTNGTFVNGKELQDAHPLRHLDQIGLGNGTPLLRFHDDEATVMLPRTLKYVRREQRFVYKGVPLDLSPNLQRLLMHLFINVGQVCTRESCIQAIWNDAQPDAERIPLLHKEISELRDKFQAVEVDAEVIKTRRSIGYYLDVEPEKAGGKR